MKYKISIITILILLLSPFNCFSQEPSKTIKIFSIDGKLMSETTLNQLEWLKIGDFKVIDLGNDNIPEILISASENQKPYLKIFRLDGSLLYQFLAYPESYLGGVNFEVNDLNNDGRKEIITAATFNGDPHIQIFNISFKNLMQHYDKISNYHN